MKFRGVGGILLAGALTGALALSGCGGDSPPVTAGANPTGTMPDDQLASSSASIPALEAERWPSVAPAQKPASKPAEPPVPALSSLAGVEDIRVLALLGNPHFKRTDAPAELWQYRLNGCVLDLFLYPKSGGGMTVDHVTTRKLEDKAVSSGADGQACFAAIVRAARAASPS
jgi:hypothetical protein